MGHAIPLIKIMQQHCSSRRHVTYFTKNCMFIHNKKTQNIKYNILMLDFLVLKKMGHVLEMGTHNVQCHEYIGLA